MRSCNPAFLVIAVVLLVNCGGSGGSGDATPTSPAGTPSPNQVSSPSSDGTWQEFRSEGGGYTVLMPGQPQEETIAMELVTGSEVQATFARVEVDQVTYMVMYIDLPPESLEIGPDEYFRQYIDNVVQKIESDSGVDIQDPTVTDITLDGNPGREFVISVSEEDLLSRHRTYLVADRQYLLQATGPQEKVSTDETTRYLDSFKLVE